jgi:hypothetical protein
MKKLTFTVKRGKSIGTVLTPHRHGDGFFVVSMTRFKDDYIRVKDESDLSDWINKGFSVRMSDQGCSPSLIAPASIVVAEYH